MAQPSPQTRELRSLIAERRGELDAVLARYGAANPKLCGSVAKGTARPGSDIDIPVDMDPADGNILLRASGLMEEVREIFDPQRIDIFPVQLLRVPMSQEAMESAVGL